MNYQKLLCVGPGGRSCICCFAAPRSKERKLKFRSAKRREKHLALKEETEYND